MKEKKIRLLKTGYSQMSSAQFVKFVEGPCISLTTGEGADVFTTNITNLIPEIVQKLGYYNIAVEMPDSARSAALRKQHRAEIVELMVILAGRIEDAALGDLATLAASGFEIKKIGVANNSILSAPTNVRCRHTKTSGVLQLICDAMKRCRMYFVEYRLGNGDWIVADSFTDTREMLIKGLVPGSSYSFRICAKGRTGLSKWTESTSIICL
jgi:hypothetical protein